MASVLLNVVTVYVNRVKTVLPVAGIAGSVLVVVMEFVNRERVV